MHYLREIMIDSFIDVLSNREKDIQLADVLEDWVELHDAIDRTGGDFSLYQAVVIMILAEIPEKDHLSSIFSRPLLDFSHGTPACLDRGFWNAAVFRRTYGSSQQDDDESP